MKTPLFLTRCGFLKTALASLGAAVLSACTQAVEQITATLAPSATPAPTNTPPVQRIEPETQDCRDALHRRLPGLGRHCRYRLPDFHRSLRQSSLNRPACHPGALSVIYKPYFFPCVGLLALHYSIPSGDGAASSAAQAGSTPAGMI